MIVILFILEFTVNNNNNNECLFRESRMRFLDCNVRHPKSTFSVSKDKHESQGCNSRRLQPASI